MFHLLFHALPRGYFYDFGKKETDPFSASSCPFFFNSCKHSMRYLSWGVFGVKRRCRVRRHYGGSFFAPCDGFWSRAMHKTPCKTPLPEAATPLNNVANDHHRATASISEMRLPCILSMNAERHTVSLSAQHQSAPL